MSADVVRFPKPKPRLQDEEAIQRARRDAMTAIMQAGAGLPTEGLPSVETAWRLLLQHGPRP